MAKPKSRVCEDGKIRGTGRPAVPAVKCLTPGCELMFGGDQEKKGGRGLCHQCHNNASSLIKRGLTTWEELEGLGLSQPKYGSLIELALRKARYAKSKLESTPTPEVKDEATTQHGPV